jgi:hypothetical protein
VEALEAELRRVGDENKRLSEMLRALLANYTELQGQVNDMVVVAAANRQSSTSEGGSAASPSRKRIRSDSLDTAPHHHQNTRKPSPSPQFAAHDQMECTSAAATAAAAFHHEPGSRVREECKSKVSRRYVHADPSDLSLVSNGGCRPVHHRFFFFFFLSLARRTDQRVRTGTVNY